MKERLSHLFIYCCVQVEFISSYNCKVCTRGNVTLATAHSRRLPQKTKWIIFLKKKTPSNSDETGPGERTREGDHRLKV